MSISGIYRITCTTTGKIYIGSSVNVRARWAGHRCSLSKGRHHSIHLQRAWNKHGGEGFVFDLLERAETSALLEREQHYLDLLKPYRSRGFNIAPRAGHTLGAKRTPEQIEKMARHHRGKTITEEHRSAISAAIRGRIHSAETKRKISKALKINNGQRGRALTDLQRKALHRDGEDHAWFGRRHSDESRRKQSLAKTRYGVSQLSQAGAVLRTWPSAKEAALGVGLRSPDSIYRAVSNPSRQAAGHYWQRAVVS